MTPTPLLGARTLDRETARKYRKSGKLEPSFVHYRQALRINPELKSAHEYIGEAYLASGDKANQ